MILAAFRKIVRYPIMALVAELFTAFVPQRGVE
jgi:hypothetical protein